MNVKIFTEAGDKTGYGHISRCFALYEDFKARTINPVFYIHGNEDIGKTFGLEDSINYCNWLSDKDLFPKLIQSQDIIIIDSYQAEPWHYEFASEKSSLCVIFDDNNRIPYPRGIIVNGALAASNLNYPDNDRTIKLLGIEYQPVRSAFKPSVYPEIIEDEVRQVFLTLGGSDNHDLSVKIIDALIETFESVHIHLMATNNYNLSLLEKKFNSTVEFHINIGAKEMIEVLSKCDLAISAAGQTLFEIILTQTPLIAIGVAENQKINIESWLQKGLIIFAGWWKDSQLIDNLISICTQLETRQARTTLVHSMQIFVKSLPPGHLTKTILKYYFDNVTTVRDAQKEDVNNLFYLANDPEVRKNSFTPEKIRLPDHQRWYASQLNNKNCVFYITQVNYEFSGQVRFDIENKNAVVNISFAEKFRGKGLGPIALTKALKRLKETHPFLDNVTAFVKTNNDASRFLFLKAGFELSCLKDNIYTFVFYFNK